MTKESPKLHGRVVAIGKHDNGDGQTTIVVSCDKEVLRAFADSLHGMRVTIERCKESPEGGV